MNAITFCQGPQLKSKFYTIDVRVAKWVDSTQLSKPLTFDNSFVSPHQSDSLIQKIATFFFVLT